MHVTAVAWSYSVQNANNSGLCLTVFKTQITQDHVTAWVNVKKAKQGTYVHVCNHNATLHDTKQGEKLRARKYVI
jgi:hypothetical protein